MKNKIKEKVIKAFPDIYDLWMDVTEECSRFHCNECPLYNASFPNYHGKTCIHTLLSPLYELTSEIFKEENLKKGNTNA